MDPTVVVSLPPGQVTLSDRRTESHWSVTLDGYLLGATPVTQAAYEDITGQLPSAARGDRLPVESVSGWDDVGFRLARSLPR